MTPQDFIAKWKRAQFLSVLALLATPLAAGPWSMKSCDPAGAAGWQAFERAMRAAKPGSTIYVPVPFPSSTEQVVQDFVYQYSSLVSGLPTRVRTDNERAMKDLSSNGLKYEAVRVENWGVSRCYPDQKRDYYTLLRIYEGDGTEIVRALLADSGLLGTWDNLPATVPDPVPPFSRRLPSATLAMAQLNEELGLSGTDPEYVTTGGDLECYLTFPCLAFREGALAYIVFRDGEIYEVPANGPNLTRGKEVLSVNETDTRNRLAPEDRLVSLGGKAFTIARRVDPATIRSKKSAFGH